MTEKTLIDLEGECCYLAALAALRPIILNLAARLDALHDDLARVKGAGCIVAPNKPEATAA